MGAAELYAKFMIALGFGLAGISLVLKTILDTLLQDWDVAHDLKKSWKSLYHIRPRAETLRADDILTEIERNSGKRNLTENALDRRREELRGLREAEDRLAAPTNAAANVLK